MRHRGSEGHHSAHASALEGRYKLRPLLGGRAVVARGPHSAVAEGVGDAERVVEEAGDLE